jgi:hypothetical protein
VGKSRLLFTMCLNQPGGPAAAGSDDDYVPTTYDTFGTSLYMGRPLAAFLTELGARACYDPPSHMKGRVGLTKRRAY